MSNQTVTPERKDQTTTSPTDFQDTVRIQTLASMRAAISELRSQILRPLSAGKSTLYVLLAQTFPSCAGFTTTGKVSVAAAANNAPGTVSLQGVFSSRCTSFEVWNFDTTNGLAITLDSGQVGAALFIAAGGYYVQDINLPGNVIITASNGATAAVNCQLKLNGM